MMYYVVKATIENNQNTQEIRPHEDYRQALIDFHNVFGGTIAYDTVEVCMMQLIDIYGNKIEEARYEKPIEETNP